MTATVQVVVQSGTSCLVSRWLVLLFTDLIEELWRHPQMVLEGVDIFGAELSGEKCRIINSYSDGVHGRVVFSIIGDDSQSFDESDIQLSTDNLDSGNRGGVVQAAIVMGPETIEDTIGNIAFTVYRDDALFVRDGGQNNQVVHSGGNNDVRRNNTVNTNIIGASLGTNVTKHLNDPVTITLAHKHQNARNPQCVYWEYAINAWLSDGCNMTNTSETQTECQCNHLTNFAVLMDVSGIPRRSERVERLFRILSYIGCSLSIVGLLVTLAVYITDR
ncbi:latrophilin Cirl-like [Strongylocentrotus purpuratus]|uniref:GAIN-B domain-containing protein n=1 Tax=Strongylocentrotus purpuratus TaxID=7668 RepID=A0A7M7PH72_STRPU|nr:latrophilin Cirl-like [Strongylocentrotus purpuratus]